MKKKDSILILILILLFLISINLCAQVVGEPNKCYVICEVTSYEYEMIDKEVAVYTGKEMEGIELETVKIKVKEGITKWVKNEKNNQYELKEEGAEYEELVILKDLTKSDNYYLDNVEVKTVVDTEKAEEWREVVCENKISEALIYEIQMKLEDKGYEINPMDGELNHSTNRALTRFQKEHNLPIGNMNVETLKKLKIENW